MKPDLNDIIFSGTDSRKLDKNTIWMDLATAVLILIELKSNAKEEIRMLNLFDWKSASKSHKISKE